MALQAEVKDSSKFAPVCNPWKYRTTAMRRSSDPLDPQQKRKGVGYGLRPPGVTSPFDRMPHPS